MVIGKRTVPALDCYYRFYRGSAAPMGSHIVGAPRSKNKSEMTALVLYLREVTHW
jgi:hypothetical protein